MLQRLTIVLMLMLTVACDSAQPVPASAPEDPPSLNNAKAITLCPLADGGAYAYTDVGLYYLKGAEAIKVKEVDTLSIKPSAGKLDSRERWLFAMWRTAEMNSEYLREELDSRETNNKSSYYEERDPRH